MQRRKKTIMHSGKACNTSTMVRHTDAPNKSLNLSILFKPMKKRLKAILNIELIKFWKSSLRHTEGLELRLNIFRLIPLQTYQFTVDILVWLSVKDLKILLSIFSDSNYSCMKKMHNFSVWKSTLSMKVSCSQIILLRENSLHWH